MSEAAFLLTHIKRQAVKVAKIMFVRLSIKYKESFFFTNIHLIKAQEAFKVEGYCAEYSRKYLHI